MTNPALLPALKTKYNATTVSTIQARIVNKALSYKTSGRLHDTEDITTLKAETIPGVQADIAKVPDIIDNLCKL